MLLPCQHILGHDLGVISGAGLRGARARGVPDRHDGRPLDMQQPVVYDLDSAIVSHTYSRRMFSNLLARIIA